MKNNKKIKKKMKKLEKALRRYDWEPGENQVKFQINDFDEVIERYMDLFEEVTGKDLLPPLP
jgi:hypothetical protein